MTNHRVTLKTAARARTEMTVRTDDTGFGGLVILQDPDAFCYGVDAVLLAGFAAERAKNAKRIMDLGTGNGIVPLILAHKTKAPVLMGMDIQPGSLELARETAGINGLTDRLSFMECDVTDIPAELKGTFDAVTCNPPYKKSGSGLPGSNPAKHTARHETTAGLWDFLSAASMLLAPKGEAYMINRPERLTDLICFARDSGLETKELCFVSGHAGEAPNLVLVRMIKGGAPGVKVLEPLHVRETDGSYSSELLRIYERL